MNFATRIGLFLCLTASAYAQVDGRWELSVTIAAGDDQCILELSETNGQVKGTYSGILGQDKPVKGTYQDHKLYLTFSGDWPTDGTSAHVTLDGNMSGDSGSGNVVITDRGDGTWTAHRAKQAEVFPAANSVAVDSGSVSRLATAVKSDEESLPQELADKVSVLDPRRKLRTEDFGLSS